jgi:hypothetical protein
MPDAAVNLDLPEVPPDRQPILPLGPHDFVESEFPAGKGHCDRCGGGPLAAIHTHVDPLERIAVALEEIAEMGQAFVAYVRHIEEMDKRLAEAIHEKRGVHPGGPGL